jgi:hypothetical protein
VGFATPLALYLKPNAQIFRNGFLESVMKLSLSESLLKKDIGAYYRLASIEIWGRLFVMRQPITEVESLIASKQELK